VVQHKGTGGASLPTSNMFRQIVANSPDLTAISEDFQLLQKEFQIVTFFEQSIREEVGQEVSSLLQLFAGPLFSSFP
jgi:hypothetical protein